MDKKIAISIGELLTEYKVKDVVVLDLTECNSWTDFFVIGTLSSSVQWKGSYKHLKDFSVENDLEISIGKKKTEDDDMWHLIDLGGIVVHLMLDEARKFYELEKVWYQAPVIYSSKEE